jgi:hypothetical protein
MMPDVSVKHWSADEEAITSRNQSRRAELDELQQ